MAPTSCCYSRVPTDEFPKNLEDRKLPVWVGILLGLLVVGLFVAVGVLAAKANSSACKDGLQAEQECRNHTHLLEQELTRAQEVLRGTEAQAATCNQTVETLKISLEKQQELSLQKLQEEIKTLNQSLQIKSSELQKKSEELEQLRKENEALVFSKGPTNDKGPTNAKGPPNSGITLRLSVAAVLLPLSLLALLA